MKGNGARKEMLMDTHKANQQADIEIANHQFGKKSHHIICILIHFCIYCCNFIVRFVKVFFSFVVPNGVKFFLVLRVSVWPKIYLATHSKG
jgi:hypothetical protein